MRTVCKLYSNLPVELELQNKAEICNYVFENTNIFISVKKFNYCWLFTQIIPDSLNYQIGFTI